MMMMMSLVQILCITDTGIPSEIEINFICSLFCKYNTFKEVQSFSKCNKVGHLESFVFAYIIRNQYDVHIK